jgi:hypothetical protein
MAREDWGLGRQRLLAGDGSPAVALSGNTPDLAHLGRPGSDLDGVRPGS